MELSKKEKKLIFDSLEFVLNEIDDYIDDEETNRIMGLHAINIRIGLLELLDKFEKEIKEN